MMITIQVGGFNTKALEKAIPRKPERSKSLSANGSRKVPSSVRFLNVLAINPSSASVETAIRKRISAMGLK